MDIQRNSVYALSTYVFSYFVASAVVLAPKRLVVYAEIWDLRIYSSSDSPVHDFPDISLFDRDTDTFQCADSLYNKRLKYCQDDRIPILISPPNHSAYDSS